MGASSVALPLVVWHTSCARLVVRDPLCGGARTTTQARHEEMGQPGRIDQATGGPSPGRVCLVRRVPPCHQPEGPRSREGANTELLPIMSPKKKKTDQEFVNRLSGECLQSFVRGKGVCGDLDRGHLSWSAAEPCALLAAR